MSNDDRYDIVISGGGLAGLSLSILLAKKNYKVALIEKEKYPFQRVCGEYISMESWPFLMSLGLPLDKMKLPHINKVQITGPSGSMLESSLDLGGFGISRYKLDHDLSNCAKKFGVHLIQNTKVKDIQFCNNEFVTTTADSIFKSKLAVAATGKRSNLDIRLNRPFIKNKRSRLNNYIGVKYHVKMNMPADTIALHNFSNGYLGVSKVEDDISCLCYLTTAGNLKKSGNSIKHMEENILCKNPFIHNIMSKAEVIAGPVTISQISFNNKDLVEKNVIMIGDAAGMITPLCGNGMSMAFRSANILNNLVDDYLNERISLKKLELGYKHSWEKAFSNRLTSGRIFQSLFGKNAVTNMLIFILKHMPLLTKKLIRTTHGESF